MGDLAFQFPVFFSNTIASISVENMYVILPIKLRNLTIIEIGDKVIVFARHDSISEIEKIFSVGIGFY